MYIIEAALEYFFTMMVAGSFLATLTKELGMTDSLTGVLSSVVSLGCLFQLFSLLIRPKKAKKLVIVLSMANQTLFTLLYIIPVIKISPIVKTVLFVTFIVVGYMIFNFAHPK